MEFLKKIRMHAILSSVLTILIGLLFVLFPYSAGSTIAMLAGIAILCLGVFDVVRYFTAGGYSWYVRESLFIGILKLILGIYVVTHTDTVMTLFSYIFGIFIIVSGITSLQDSFRIKDAGVSGWGLTMCLSILVAAAGVIMLFCPIEAASTAAAFIGVALLAEGAVNLLTLWQLKKIKNDFLQDLKDIQDERNGNIIDMEEH